MENKANNIDIEQLVLKYWEGVLNAEEHALLSSWISASESNQKQFEDYLSILVASGANGEVADLHLLEDISWKKLSTSIKEPKRFNLKRVLSIAVAACLLGIFLIIGLNKGTDSTRESFTFSTNTELSKELVLPDGSKVWLNKASAVKYVGTEDTRSVWLEGEGFFEVKTDSLRAFEVHAGTALTKVLGTSFNIDARNVEEVVIRVASGRVSFEQEQNETVLLLEKGEQAIAKESEGSVEQLEDVGVNTSVWKTGMLRFDKTSLNHISDELLAQAGIKLVFEDPAVGACLLTAEFPLDDLEILEEVLRFVLDLDIDRSNDQAWIVKGKGCE